MRSPFCCILLVYRSPGRVDVIRKLDYASPYQIEQLFARFFPDHKAEVALAVHPAVAAATNVALSGLRIRETRTATYGEHGVPAELLDGLQAGPARGHQEHLHDYREVAGMICDVQAVYCTSAGRIIHAELLQERIHGISLHIMYDLFFSLNSSKEPRIDRSSEHAISPAVALNCWRHSEEQPDDVDGSRKPARVQEVVDRVEHHDNLARDRERLPSHATVS